MPLADTLFAQEQRVEESQTSGLTYYSPSEPKAPVYYEPPPKPTTHVVKVLKPAPPTVKVTGPLFPVLGGGAHISQMPGPTHEAIDIGATLGSPVIAPVSGYISRTQDSTQGYGIAAWMIDPVTGEELTFGHLLQRIVEKGQQILQGQVIGYVGSTGASSGPHLHFEVGAPGAQPFLGNASEQGAVDPLAWLKGAQPVAGAASGIAVGPSSVVTPPPGIVAAASPPVLSNDWFANLIAPAAQTASGAVQTGSVGMPGGTTPEAGKQAAEAAAKAEDTGGILGLGWLKSAANPDVPDSAASRLKGYFARAGFVGAGLLLVVLGIAAIAFSYREQIGMAAAKYGGAAIGSAAGNPAAGAGAIAGG